MTFNGKQMTFDEALASLRDPNGNASPEGLALAEQVEANSKAIEELRSKHESHVHYDGWPFGITGKPQ